METPKPAELAKMLKAAEKEKRIQALSCISDNPALALGCLQPLLACLVPKKKKEEVADKAAEVLATVTSGSPAVAAHGLLKEACKKPSKYKLIELLVQAICSGGSRSRDAAQCLENLMKAVLNEDGCVPTSQADKYRVLLVSPWEPVSSLATVFSSCSISAAGEYGGAEVPAYMSSVMVALTAICRHWGEEALGMVVGCADFLKVAVGLLELSSIRSNILAFLEFVLEQNGHVDSRVRMDLALQGSADAAIKVVHSVGLRNEVTKEDLEEMRRGALLFKATFQHSRVVQQNICDEATAACNSMSCLVEAIKCGLTSFLADATVSDNPTPWHRLYSIKALREVVGSILAYVDRGELQRKAACTAGVMTSMLNMLAQIDACDLKEFDDEVVNLCVDAEKCLHRASTENGALTADGRILADPILSADLLIQSIGKADINRSQEGYWPCSVRAIRLAARLVTAPENLAALVSSPGINAVFNDFLRPRTQNHTQREAIANLCSVVAAVAKESPQALANADLLRTLLDFIASGPCTEEEFLQGDLVRENLCRLGGDFRGNPDDPMVIGMDHLLGDMDQRKRSVTSRSAALQALTSVAQWLGACSDENALDTSSTSCTEVLLLAFPTCINLLSVDMLPDEAALAPSNTQLVVDCVRLSCLHLLNNLLTLRGGEGRKEFLRYCEQFCSPAYARTDEEEKGGLRSVTASPVEEGSPSLQHAIKLLQGSAQGCSQPSHIPPVDQIEAAVRAMSSLLGVIAGHPETLDEAGSEDNLLTNSLCACALQRGFHVQLTAVTAFVVQQGQAGGVSSESFERIAESLIKHLISRGAVHDALRRNEEKKQLEAAAQAEMEAAAAASTAPSKRSSKSGSGSKAGQPPTKSSKLHPGASEDRAAPHCEGAADTDLLPTMASWKPLVDMRSRAVGLENNIPVSALLLGAYLGLQEMGRMLLSVGADVNVCDSHGRTPLMYAFLRGLGGLAADLISAGAQVDAVDAQGIPTWAFALCSPDYQALEAALMRRLSHVVLRGSSSGYEMATLLICSGCDVNACDAELQRPLHWVIIGTSLEAVWPISSLKPGQSSAHVTMEYNGSCGGTDWMMIADRLLAAGADINAVDSYGRTALACAAEFGLMQGAVWLLDRGADPNIRDHSGRLPLHHVCEWAGAGSVELAQKLVRTGERRPLREGLTEGISARILQRKRATCAAERNRLDIEDILSKGFVQVTAPPAVIQLAADRQEIVNCSAGNGDTPLSCAQETRGVCRGTLLSWLTSEVNGQSLM
jgi:ankyrin repeat protein